MKDDLSTPGSVEKTQPMASSASPADSHEQRSDSIPKKKKKKIAVGKLKSDLDELKSCDYNAFENLVFEMVNSRDDIKLKLEDSLIDDIGVRKLRTLHAELRDNAECKTSFYKENAIPTIEDRYDTMKRCVPELLSLIEKCLYPEKVQMKITNFEKRSTSFQESINGTDINTPHGKINNRKRQRSQDLAETTSGFRALATLQSLEDNRFNLEARINEIKYKATNICELIMNIRANGSLFTPTALEVGLISALCAWLNWSRTRYIK